MKISTNLFLLLGLSASTIFAQEVSGYEKVMYTAPDEIELDGANVSTKNIVSQADHCKMAFTLVNNSTDLLLFDANEVEFSYPFGTKNPSLKSFILNPGDKKTKTLLVKGTENYLQKEFKMDVKGLYKIPVNGTVTEAPQFQLPASTNNFVAGNFKVQLKKYDASTKEATAVFECTYVGDEIALVDPTSLSVTTNRNKSTDEVTYANDDKKSEIEILKKNETVEFKAVFHIPGKIADMQFAIMKINWNKTFVETTKEPIASEVLTFTMDEAATEAAK